ncbi:hypothetical protein PV11_08450 [Exophiala sideris]|uniref:Zn(2)-C6 fungal-type domain-containing protein n=1 Tax=Exophiala sideris TaxID=1016849 RepID=A0A0D1X0L7_9EURO|nr:hypothetical protein PV11_08450 [Exophiala sideris]
MSSSQPIIFDGPPENRRVKTHLACETCRRRKSRCDGNRPSCRHCLEARRVCRYRDPLTSIEADASVLARLAAVEARLETFSQTTGQIPSSTTCEPPAVDSNSVTESDQYKIPEFHHGGNHKIMQYWSRLRVRLTLPDVNVLQYLKAADDDFSGLMDTISTSHPEAHIDANLLALHLDAFYHQISQLPIAMGVLLTHCNLFSFDAISAECGSGGSVDMHTPTATRSLSELSLEQHLIYTIALHPTNPAMSGAVLVPSQRSTICFKLALQNLWKVHLKEDALAVPLIVCFAQIFLYVFNKPFHALSMLQTIDEAVERLTKHEVMDTTRLKTIRHSQPAKSISLLYSRLFYLLQSDILSEIDGTPSKRVPPNVGNETLFNRNPQSPTVASSRSAIVGEETGDMFNAISTSYSSSHDVHTVDLDFLFSANLWLRACLNRILGKMFTIDQAYCQPDDVGPIIAQIYSVLDAWYQALPLSLHFSRDIRTFKLLMPSISLRLRELSVRYHACVFILNRPVLYWILYQNLEQTASPPSPSGAEEAAVAERHLNAWVLDSCHACIESAKLIIYNLARPMPHCNSAHTTSLTWCDVQLLVGAYVVLLSVQTATQFSSEFRDQQQIDETLDLAEVTLSGVSDISHGFMRTLEIITNIRQGFENPSPVTFAI